MSKATPRAAVAKFAAAGKSTRRKDLGLLAISYGNIYVARIAFGANDAHTIGVLQEAEACDGPSLIIACSHCIAHGYDMKFGLEQTKAAVEKWLHWPLYRYNPDLALEEKNPFSLDSRRKPQNQAGGLHLSRRALLACCCSKAILRSPPHCWHWQR